MQDSDTMLILAGFLAALTFELGVLVQALPFTFFRRLKMLGPILMRDSIFTLAAIASVGLIQLAVAEVSEILLVGLDLPSADSTASSALIIAQLIDINALLFLLIAGLNSTVILAPVAAAVASMLSPVLQTVTTATVLWVMLESIIRLLPSVWLWFYVLGIVLVSVPFRFTHAIGTTAMSGAVATAILLPLAPAFALQIQHDLSIESLQPIRQMVDEIQANPLKAFDIPSMIFQIAKATASLTASLVIALIVFPFAWMFMISIISKSIAELIGGTSLFNISSFVISPARQAGGVTRQ